MSTSAIDDQPLRRRISIFKQSTQLLSVATGCFIQRITANDLRRLRRPDADQTDPAVRELQKERLDETFRRCNDSKVYLSDSIDAILNVHEDDRKSDGALLLAWSYGYDSAARRLSEPTLVGAATLSRFVSSDQFSTHEAALTEGDYATLQPYFRGRYMYLDAMCSTKPGVGRLLLMKAYQLALMKKADGLIALSYMKTRTGTPESKRLFDMLGFDVLIQNAKYKAAFLKRNQIYGAWYVKRTDALGVSSIAEGGIRVCTRRGYTERTSDYLMWRCPN